ncbi:SDR family oxidoreductase [Chitinophaga agrisoli]|uniref:SDR family oxidoreductase n=1 Tax=Chitinophaga agrisoli TaxID=2607653 RepID=A0A5B2VPB1_9BACT|nr:SDR family oxidoreductase [Chitinophaga agrisoli]KAA2239919.1 SDR family oxidoreductase [Chitinophaga agrisoli]
MTLNGKNAVVHGAGGSLGGAVARALARAGAHVWLTGRTSQSLEQVAADITGAGGKATTAVLDALDEKAVRDFLEKKVGSIDISFNAIGWQDKQNLALTDMLLEDFIRPVNIAMQTQFITCTAAARIMMQQRSGVILSLTATPGGIGYPHVGGFGPACCAVESFSRDLASELGPYGVRVVNIRSGGSPDSAVFANALKADPERAQFFITKMKEDTMLKEMPMMADIANAAVFLASDSARRITGITLDITCGTTTALNYKIPDIAFVEEPANGR